MASGKISYKSTRGGDKGLSFEEAVFSGLASDGGLLVPDSIPDVSHKLKQWSALSFGELAFEIASLYCSEDEVPGQDLREILTRSYTTFSHDDVVPTVPLDDFYVMELFHGPTFAFKDVALQALGNLYEYFLKRNTRRLTVVGATSGDTGGAAIYGLRGKQNVECFILFPKGRVSKIQQQQMTSVLDANVHCVAVEGTFDDCQDIVKGLFADLDFKKTWGLGAVNSINWARIMFQITYYFYTYFKLYPNCDGKVSFSVPTGNFGDILAGYYAKRMGLPVKHLIVATNSNDILHRFMTTGVYDKQIALATCAPSMDIGVSSNFERYLFDLFGSDAAILAGMMETFKTTGKLHVSSSLLEKAQADFLCARSSEEQIAETMKNYKKKHGYVLCPHSACGVSAVDQLRGSTAWASEEQHKMVVLATAHPAKFEEAVEKILDCPPIFPPQLEAVRDAKTRFLELPNSIQAVRDTIVLKVAGREVEEQSAVAEPAQKKARMERTFLFSSESVNEGHPDKLCDQVSDAVLDTCLATDPKSKVACETATKDNMVAVMGEITTQAKIDYEKVVRGVVAKIGFDSFVDDLSSVDSKGLSDKTCEVIVRINKQSPDIAGGVHVGKDEMDVGAGDQGIMFGYASDETEDCMPLTHSMATRLGKKLTDVRKNGKLWWLRPDGKTQVTIEYLQKADGAVEPQKIHTVVISTQHAEPLKAVRTKECAGYSGPEMTAPSMEEMNKLIVEEVIKETLKEITLKNGKAALTLFGDHTHLHINPSGKFIIGGPQGDAGLTGRKIIIDTYGGWGAHGGGAFSGKDPTKVDRSAAYICRQMAKSVVKSGLCKRALVQLSYAIGVAKPLSLFVETYGTEQGALSCEDVTNIIKIEFDCRPGAIAISLALREPKYQETAAYCHFGREPYTKDGMKFFEWENAKDLSKYKPMNSAEVDAALKASNHTAKWVD